MEKDDEISASNKMNALNNVITNGRSDEDSWMIVKPIFAAMSLPQEKKASMYYKSQSNMSGRVDYNKEYGHLNGKYLGKVMTRQRVAMTLLVVENNLSREKDGTCHWKKKDRERKYTPASARTSSGGWTQAGLDRYHELLQRESKERKELDAKYKDDATARPDYFVYPRKEKVKTSTKKSKGVEEPEDADVAVGVDNEDLIMLESSGEETDTDEDNQVTPVPV